MFDGFPIPSSGFENLPNLTRLNLSNSDFTGQIPVGISRLTNLVSLDLSSRFSSPPLQLKDPNFETLVRNLGNLRELYLDGIEIPESVGRLARALAKAAPRIKVLSLSLCSLSGPIDSSLLKLSTLSVLNLSGNELNSPVPDFLANFSSLTVLRLAYCRLRGLFPTSVFRLKSLTHVDLSDNPMLSGSLPDFAQGSGLESLLLQETNFSGNLPSSIGHLKSLKTLVLSKCYFSGAIPTSIAYLSQLLTLDLSHNTFSGAIPSVMPPTISELNLAGNLLTGSIPQSSFGELLHLRRLDLANNSLTGQVPASLFIHPSLQYLDLSLNKLSGQIQEFSNASSMLQILDLSDNVMSGEVPSSVFQLSGLVVLNLARNDFNGTIETDWFRGLKNLSHIDLSYNSLSVQVGDATSSLPYPTMYEFLLASCNLTEVPSFLRYQYSMEILDLSSNRISGAIPNWIWGIGRNLNLSHNQFTSVERPLPSYSNYSMWSLDLHSNMLQGPIPIPTTDMVILDYSNNKFSSSIPTNISLYLAYAIFFSLANNSIKGEIPPSICEAISLKVLDFSDNFFSGPIPPCLLEISNDLHVLNLRNNQLQSVMPWNVSRSCGLSTLNLNGNYLEGRVPPSLTKCHGLEVLDLGNNRIADSFPHWLSSIPSLRVLVLRSNEFYGPIFGPALGSNATNHYTFSELQILDLSSNHFNGILPLDFLKGLKGMMVDLSPNCSTLEFGYMTLSSSSYYDAVTIIAKGVEYSLVRILTTFTAIDLSDNGFTGNIPELIGELRYLHMLNLSQNALTGQIPASIGNMMQLESLDVSHNGLSGEIPQGLVNLSFLSVLNLSDNKLIGRIPRGGQMSTFSSTSYQGNQGLCGILFPKQCDYAGPPSIIVHSDDSDSTYVIGLALFTGLGYGVGIAMVLVLPNVSVRRGRRGC